MRRFRQIAVVDYIGGAVRGEALEQIRALSENPVVFPEADAADAAETIRRIGTADAVLGTWNTTIDSHVLDACPSIEYIGICGTGMVHVDSDEVKRRNIALTNVTGYSEDATAEWVFLQLLRLARGSGKYMWKNGPCELAGKTLGIVGLGAVGRHVAQLGLGFKMHVLYTGLTARPETPALTFCDLPHLLAASDVVSLHVPQTALVLRESEFALMRPGCILVDTCLGVVFDKQAFVKWLAKGQNLVVFDRKDALPEEIRHLPNILGPDIVEGSDGGYAGRTLESRDRAARTVIENLQGFLQRT